jgi:hypothetical protein
MSPGIPAEYFTSQIDVLMTNSYASCANGKSPDKSVWLPGFPRAVKDDKACVSLNLGAKSAGLQDVPCTSKYKQRVICERRKGNVKYMVIIKLLFFYVNVVLNDNALLYV